MIVSEQLGAAECRDLLERCSVGRVAVCTPVGPRIVLVSYILHGDAVVFRTSPYSELSTYGWDADLAFEVDALEEPAQRGWSVVAVGRAHLVADPDEVRDILREHQLQAWAPGSRNLYVQLPWRQLTGVRLGDGGRPQPIEPHRDTV
jgi:nitroimidazol reductase NimA-like FMN-containing flavoprotein (pyridoxamine 5'-phosphate oxidase superfamily)